MTRQDFLKMCGILGIGMPVQATFSACGEEVVPTDEVIEKVIVVGAGAAGLSAAYLLTQRGIEVVVLEAASIYGGRMKVNTDFADFPLPLGAEWLHADTGVFREMVNDVSVTASVKTISYNKQQDTYGYWNNGKLTVGKLDDSDIKFVNYSWLQFFEEYILPSIREQMLYHTVVEAIDYSGERVRVETDKGVFVADRVIVTVPLKMLQEGAISFSPSLPASKLKAIEEATVWPGFKAFIAFSERFYPTQTGFNIQPATDGQKLYYDAAYGQDTTMHILGLFVVGKPAEAYLARSGEELRNFMLQELDAIFGQAASRSYVKHLVQNWEEEPFIRGAYLTDHESWRRVRTLGEAVANRVYFAGGAYTSGDDWVSVHLAAEAARNVVEGM